MSETIRLNKFIASCGVCSRREADRLIEAGKVTVDGHPAQMGGTVTGTERIVVDGTLLQGRTEKVVLAYYKPVGVTCSEKDDHADRLVTEELNYPVRVTYAGRLDRDSEGLLLLSNDGELLEALMRSRNGHEREYVVTVNKDLKNGFPECMEPGVYLEQLDVKTKPCKVKVLGKRTFSVTLNQGLNRQIRRMCGAFGYRVDKLKRVRVQNVLLGDLGPGEYRVLCGEELEELYSEVGLR